MTARSLTESSEESLPSQPTVSSLMHRAETGARWPRSCVTKESLLRSQMMQVRSREPLTTMRYVDDAVRHVTPSV